MIAARQPMRGKSTGPRHAIIHTGAFCCAVVILCASVAACDSTPSATPPLTSGVTLTQPPQSSPAARPTQPAAGTVASVPVSKLGIDALPDSDGDGAVKTISCWSPGNCAAGGSYYRASPLGGDGASHAFLAMERAGHWGRAFLVPGLDIISIAYGAGASLTFVSCPSDGSCSAGGYYVDFAQAICLSCHTNAFVVNQVHGQWYRAIPLPGLRRLNVGDDATLDFGACPATGDCEVVGTYGTSNSDGTLGTQLYTDSQVGGVWQETQQLGHLSELDSALHPQWDSFECSSVSNCVAIGAFMDNGNSFRAVMQGGGWSIQGV